MKVIFPSLLSVYLTYPNGGPEIINTLRHMTFAPADPSEPLGRDNPLGAGVEELIEIDHATRSLVYVSVFGLPVADYSQP